MFLTQIWTEIVDWCLKSEVEMQVMGDQGESPQPQGNVIEVDY